MNKSIYLFSDNDKKFRFDPEVLGYIYSKSLFIWIFEALMQKGVFYMFGIGEAAFFEMLSYTGYKFVALCMIVLS